MKSINNYQVCCYRHGNGRLLFDNCDYYEGEFKDNEPHGNGKMIYAKTDIVFEGKFENGVGIINKKME